MLPFSKLSKLFLQYQAQPIQKNMLKFNLFKNYAYGKSNSFALISTEINISKTSNDSAPQANVNTSDHNIPNMNLIEVENIPYSDEIESYVVPKEKRDAFRLIEQDLPKDEDSEVSHYIDDIAPPLPISFNLAAFANRSPTIQKFIELHVNLAKIELKPENAKFIMQLDFETNVKPYIEFLHNKGVPADQLGKCITKNPYLFKHDLENLEIRLNYFKSKNFNDAAITRIITNNPIVLSMNTKNVDQQLGYFQRTFQMSGDEIRFLITKAPALISYNRQKLNEMAFSMKEEMGFGYFEMKQILLMKPGVWTSKREAVVARFNVAHNLMGLTHKQILSFPGILLKRTYQLEQRHLYLCKLRKAQYDPSKPSYIPLKEIAATTDYKFCTSCAKTSVAEFNEFLKTL